MGSKHGLTPRHRFLEKVEVGGPTDCWSWTGAIQSKGYGVFTVRPQRRHPVDPADLGCWLAHRFAFARVGGRDLDADLAIRHLCENKLCVNPAHLTPGDPTAANR